MKAMHAAVFVLLASLSGGRLALAHEDHAPAVASDGALVDADTQAAVDVVDRFGKALAAGDFATVESLLDPDVLILESGGAERDRAEYMGHHAIADAQFLQGAHVQPGARRAHASGDLAWVATESELHAREDDKPLTLASTETVVLRRVTGDWRIVHIHWSSRRKP
jgi:ketosteroid isomerase-like protein